MMPKRDRPEQGNKTASLHVKDWFSSEKRDQHLHDIRTNGNPMLTRGAFGEISVAIWKGTARWRLAVVKTITKSTTASGNRWSSMSSQQQQSPRLAPEVFHEICALRMLNGHPNIVELLAVYPASGGSMAVAQAVSLAFTYCPTDLYLTLEWRRRTLMPPLPMGVIKTVALDMFRALDHCHSHGILHRDVKAGNFLVSSDGYIQLCDFGLAKPMEEKEDEVTGQCTLYYRPPETLLGGAADSPAVDMYSSGTLLAELISGQPLFRGGNAIGQLGLVFDALGTPDITNWPGALQLPDYGKLQFVRKDPRPFETLLPRAIESPFLLELLKTTVALDPMTRLSAKEALGHPWVTAPPLPAVRESAQRELIPGQLVEPILLSNPNDEMSLACRKAVDVASARRSFPYSLNEWEGAKSGGGK